MPVIGPTASGHIHTIAPTRVFDTRSTSPVNYSGLLPGAGTTTRVQIAGVGPVPAAHILAELGDVRRFRRARQAVRLSGLDPVVSESADNRRRGKLSKQGSPELRWALVEAAHHACQRRSPDHSLYLAGKERSGSKRAALTVARKIARRAYHVLNAEAAV